MLMMKRLFGASDMDKQHLSRSELNKVISLTFDENPQIRLRAAKQLLGVDDPAAVFALFELSYDNDESVKLAAKEALDYVKKQHEEIVSLAELFSQGQEMQDHQELENEKKNKLLSPIVKLFERNLGKERAEKVRIKMMPTIEKIYYNTINKEKSYEERGKVAIQELLTGYMDAISDLDVVSNGEIEVELPSLAHKTEEIEKIEKEVNALENEVKIEEKEEETIEEEPRSIFRVAYDIMMASNGDEKIMRREQRKLMTSLENDVKLAFSLAKKKFREVNATDLTKLCVGQRNIVTEDLLVNETFLMEYPKGKRKKGLFTKLVVVGENKKSCSVYLFDGRGRDIKNGDYIKIEKGLFKKFDFSGECALTVTSKGKVYILK